MLLYCPSEHRSYDSRVTIGAHIENFATLETE